MWFYVVLCVGCSLIYAHKSDPIFHKELSCEMAATSFAQSLHSTDGRDYAWDCNFIEHPPAEYIPPRDPSL